MWPFKDKVEEATNTICSYLDQGWSIRIKRASWDWQWVWITPEGEEQWNKIRGEDHWSMCGSLVSRYIEDTVIAMAQDIKGMEERKKREQYERENRDIEPADISSSEAFRKWVQNARN